VRQTIGLYRGHHASQRQRTSLAIITNMLCVRYYAKASQQYQTYSQFRKGLPSASLILSHLGYTERLKATGLDTLELRRLHCDLICIYIKCYLVNWKWTTLTCFNVCDQITVGYQGSLVEIVPKTLSSRKHFFSVSVNYINVKNESLGSITSFKRLIKGSPFVYYS